MLTPRADGLLAAREPVLFPFMAPRLQGDCRPDGLAEVSLWGAGKLGRVRFTPLEGPYVLRPNSVSARNGGVHVAQSAPVMLVAGARAGRIHPARRCAWWHEIAADAARPEWAVEGNRRTAVLPWGVLLVEQRGPDFIIAAGASREEAERAARLPNAAIIAEAAAHAARCDLLPEADPLLRSMVIQGIHAALSSIRADETGSFAGLAAGQAYSAPARTYYRDGYWTLQPLLRLAPEAVREQIRLLARGVQPDGEAPSGVILSGLAQSAAWQAFRNHPDRYKEHHLRPGDWWSDHFDSPLFFVLALGDYVRETGDEAEADRHWPVVTAIIERYFRLAGPDGLPLKPRTDRDWADNVYREGLVSYDLGLWVGALDVATRLGQKRDSGLAQRARDAATHARQAIDGLLWVEKWHGYADYRTPDGFVEDHLVIDAVTLARYDAIPPGKARAFLEAIEKTLESRNNTAQPYGDWGVLCAFPPYKRARDIRAKTAFPFRYHNGSDWPYWDGAYAEERLRRGLGGVRYPLTRWWQYCLEQGWAGAIEYFAPPFGRGSLLQGWSAMPAAVAVKYGLAALADERPAEAVS
ncbi:MAG TPA: glycogen debranching protein [Devosia sp.]|nr:glycogen debranching protein [Devosia sp.]